MRRSGVFLFMNFDPTEKVVVQKIQGEINANMLKGLLESSGIQVWISSGNEIISGAPSRHVQGPNVQSWDIYVLKKDEAEAKEILSNNINNHE